MSAPEEEPAEPAELVELVVPPVVVLDEPVLPEELHAAAKSETDAAAAIRETSLLEECIWSVLTPRAGRGDPPLGPGP